MAMGMVAVLPGMSPASISVAPNSPSARANERIVPASTPGHASGKATAWNTRHSDAPNVLADSKNRESADSTEATAWNTRHSDAPNVLAASKNRESTCSSAARAERYISGNATTAAAITVAGQENTTVVPNRSRSFPRGPFRPNSSKRKNPTTVGGSTSGSRQIPSTSAETKPVRRCRHTAVARPATNVTAVATTLVSSDIHRGDQSIGTLGAAYTTSTVRAIGSGL